MLWHSRTVNLVKGEGQHGAEAGSALSPPQTSAWNRAEGLGGVSCSMPSIVFQSLLE